jgi:hypothetical protein
VAKGYAADAVADLLARAGIAHALVEVGGECVEAGMRPDGDPWWVDLEAPASLCRRCAWRCTSWRWRHRAITCAARTRSIRTGMCRGRGECRQRAAPPA